jgi:CRISPR type III-A-associated RAMP protein Csm5
MNDALKYEWKTERFRVRALSPFHIGDSEPWQKDFDYIYHEKSKTVFFIDFEDFLNQCDMEFLRKTDEIEAFRQYMLELFKTQKLKILRKYSLPHGNQDIYPFVCGGVSPLVPGSSIKGALRTAVISTVLREKLRNGEKVSRPPDDLLRNEVEQNSDNVKQSMDVVQVQDLPLGKDKLKLALFDSYSLQNSVFAKKKDKTRVVEAVLENTELDGELVLRFSYRETDRGMFRGVREILDISSTLKNHYLYWIPREIAFLTRYLSTEIKPVIDFYQSLLKKLENGTLLLHVGFGTGWEGKTGAFLENNRFMWNRGILDYLRSLRDRDKWGHQFMKLIRNSSRYLKCPRGHSRLDLSRNGSDNVFCPECNTDYGIDMLKVNYPFPKSRKFVSSRGLLLPPGWLELTSI